MYINVKFIRWDDDVVIVQENVLSPSKYMLMYLEVKYHDDEIYFPMIFF